MSPRREARILQHLKNRVHLVDLIKLEGLDPGNARKEIKALAAKHGLKVVEGARSDDATPFVAFTEQSTMVRLGWFMDTLRVHHTAEGISYRVGLNQAEQRRAALGKHDWTMSQLWRLGKLFGLTLDQLIALVSARGTEQQMELHQSLDRMYKNANQA